jgi:phosphohistidine phosphatase SixA
MRSWRIPAIVLAVLCTGPTTAGASETLWAKLKEGGRVALVRHAAAPGAAGDPPGFKLDDCATQRNLSDKGRADARRLGEALRSRHVPVGKVVSSQWCRCRETAALMNIGAVEMAPTFNNALVLRDRRSELTHGARAVIAAWSEPGILLVVTHGENIRALTGTRPTEGAIVVVQSDPAAASGLSVLGQIAPDS